MRISSDFTASNASATGPTRPVRRTIPTVVGAAIGLSSGLLLVVSLLQATGCNTPGMSQEMSRQTYLRRDIDLVDDLARPAGLYPLQLSGVSLVVELDGTGSDPPPSPERSYILTEMQRRRVAEPNRLLASPNTSLVYVQGIVPPGAQEGDRIDLEVSVPKNSDTSSLRGGWLMLTPLREHAIINNRPSTGHTLASGQGAIVIDALLKSGVDESNGDTAVLTKGRVLGGGKVGKSRHLGLTLRDEHTSALTSSKIGNAINERFYVYDRGVKRGVATPRTDEQIELLVHPRYQHNVLRFMRVVQNIVVRQKPDEARQRMEQLRSLLSRPSTSALAALQLEAIGKEGIPILKSALESSNEEVRFYAAEALGYLNQAEAAPVLADMARSEPAFRWRAFASLGAMDDPAAHEALFALLDVDSAETRYGAFRELRRLVPHDPVVAGTVLGNDLFWLHQVTSMGTPLVHVATEHRPEIVLFGTDDIHLQTPFVLFAGTRIVVRGESPNNVIVSRLSDQEEDDFQPTTTRLIDIIRSIVELRGSYPDVVQAITEAKKSGVLAAQLEFSAIPELGRTYLREQTEVSDSDEPVPVEEL